MMSNLPLQPVEQPIICSPYVEPDRHWQFDRSSGAPQLVAGRRDAAYWYKSPTDLRVGQLSLELEEDRRELVLVNRLRGDVRRWRGSGYEGATVVTKDLLHHWARPDRTKRLFFCQLEAIETLVYLAEIRGGRAGARRGRPRFQPAFDDVSFDVLESASAAHQSFKRYCIKLATGTGKTLVMSMLISWAFINRARNPADDRFPSTALVVCPNVTIRDRLAVLRTDAGPSNYYREFDLIPSKYRGLIERGRVYVRNWHVLSPSSSHVEGGTSYGVVEKGPEDDAAFAKTRIPELADPGGILVLNDEGHHAYTPAPIERIADLGDSDIDDIRKAKVWIEGLERVDRSIGIKLAVDLSATPFFIRGSGYPEGEPFPWIVSDFSLVDAIESGLTKIPRLPISDSTGRPDPKYFNLWKQITANLSAKQKVAGRPKPEVVWERGQEAVVQLAGEYKTFFDSITAWTPEHFIPPVLVVVCDNTQIAQLVYEKFSGEKLEAISSGAKKRRTNVGGSIFPGLFENQSGRVVTLGIDSRRLNELESVSGQETKQEAIERLRRVVATVGKEGEPGELVRCLVSVSMLTEGWDANNVSHILGLRAFSSQLLCEQVVGRGLRRRSYEPDPETGLLVEEYVDVYGIPFSLIPFKGKPSSAPVEKPATRIRALPERQRFELRIPRVEGYAYAINPRLVSADVSSVEPLRIEVDESPIATFVGIVSAYGEGVVALPLTSVEHNRAEFYRSSHLQQIQFEMARRILERLTTGASAISAMARHHLFPQVLGIVREYVDTRVDFNGANPCELGLEKYVNRVVERLLNAIEPRDSSATPLLPILNAYRPMASSGEVDFITRARVRPTVRSHVNYVVGHSSWEFAGADHLERATDMVECYFRNEPPIFTIPYVYDGVDRAFEPDFVVLLTNGKKLILEIKGQETDEDFQKYQAAQRWTSAVNYWGEAGNWAFRVARATSEVPEILRAEAELQ